MKGRTQGSQKWHIVMQNVSNIKFYFCNYHDSNFLITDILDLQKSERNHSLIVFHRGSAWEQSKTE